MTLADTRVAVHARVALESLTQGALTIVRHYVQNPVCKTVEWLDVGCHRGQLLAAASALDAKALAKVQYVGFDARRRDIASIRRHAETVFPNRHRVDVLSQLEYFDEELVGDRRFDIITLINSPYMAKPLALAHAMVSCVCRLRQGGSLIAFDYDPSDERVLGLVPWSALEFQHILHAMLGAGGVAAGSLPPVTDVPHIPGRSWSLQVHRDHLLVDSFEPHRNPMIDAAEAQARRLLEEKLQRLDSMLQAALDEGVGTAGEHRNLQHANSEYVAVARALRAQRWEGQ